MEARRHHDRRWGDADPFRRRRGCRRTRGPAGLRPTPLLRAERLDADAVLDQQLAQLTALGARQARRGTDVAAGTLHQLHEIFVLELMDGARLGDTEADLRFIR